MIEELIEKYLSDMLVDLERRGYKVLRLPKDSPIRGLKYDCILIEEYAVEET
jgi:hypothetical protein